MSTGAGLQGRIYNPVSWAAGFAAHLPWFSPDPPAAHVRLPGRAPSGAPSRVRALRSLEAPLSGRGGASVCGAGRGGTIASGAGSCRAQPSRAEPSCEVPGRGRQSLPAAPHPSCCVSRLGVPLPLPRRRKNFYCLGTPPPWMCDEIATLRCLVPKLACSGDRGNVQPSLPGSCALRFLTCRLLPGTARGDPQRGRAGIGTPKSCSPWRTGSAQL